jgi:amidase
MSDAMDLARRIGDGELTALEAVEAAIARVEARNPQLNAVVADTFDRARREAAVLDVGDRPLAGVPILMKDLGGPVEGDPAPNGNRVLRDLGRRHTVTGAVGRRLREAGTVSIGRSHSPELGSGNCPASSETEAFGPAHNPWNLSRTPMGSSGGSAAAVAAGLVPLAHATDGGGSIRMPASACGVVGLKPSRGRVSSAPDPTAWAGGVAEGVVSRTVRDTALALDILAGPEPGDDYAAPPFAGSYMSEVGRDPGRLRCGVLDRVSWATTDPACIDAVARTLDVLDGLGHDIDPDARPAPLDHLDYLFDYVKVIRASAAAVLASLEAEIGRPWTADDVEDGTWVNHQRGRKLSAPDYLGALERLHRFSLDVIGWWDDHDLLITPTLATPPPPNGFLVEGDDRQRRNRLNVTMPFTAQFNVTGQPAISVPLHWTAEGLPIGVQLVAAPGREDVLLRVAAQLEGAVPWAQRYDAIT